LSNLNGAYALIWHDHSKKSLFIAKNDERPLHTVETKIGKLIASEAGMLHWVCERFDLKPGEVKAFEDEKLYKFWKTKKGKIHHASTKYERSFSYSSAYKTNRSYGTHQLNYSKGSETTPLYEQKEKEIFKKLSLNKNQVLEVIPYSFKPYTPGDSEYGKLWATPTDKRYKRKEAVFLIHSVSKEVKDLIMDKKVKVVVTYGSMGPSPYEHTSQEIKDIKYSISTKLSQSEKDILELKEEKQGNILCLPDKGVKYKLPNGEEITRANFTERVKGGCCFCSDAIIWEERDKIDWIDDNGKPEPVCSICAQDMGVDDYFVENDGAKKELH